MRLNEPIAEDPLLTIKNLEVSFEPFDGLAEVTGGVNLFIGRGEVVAVVGKTGCGRSATAKSIFRLLSQPPARVSGDIAFGGTRLLSLSDREFEHVKGQQMSLVFQDPMSNLNSTSTVEEQLTDTAQFGGDSGTGVVEFFRRRFSGEHDEAHEHVLEVLREAQTPNLENTMDSYPSQLSGGMRQRAFIARALPNESDLPIVDEISIALDVTIHDQILDLLKGLIENRDLGALTIIHNLGVAWQVNDRVYVMYGGRIVETAPADELFENPRHPYTQGLIVLIPRLMDDEMATGVDGSVPEYLDPPPGCRFTPWCFYATVECEEVRPKVYERGPQTGVECVLYDEVIPASGWPTIEGIRNHMTWRPGKQTGGN